MRELPEQFKTRMRGLLGAEYEAFISAYALPPVRGLRVNLLKQSAEGLIKCCPWGLRPCGILDEGFICEAPEGVGRHPLHAAGLFYMQGVGRSTVGAALSFRFSCCIRASPRRVRR